MNKPKFIAFLLLILLSSQIIGLVSGAWTEEEKEGNWEIATDTHWKTNATDTSWSTAYLNYNQSLTNFTYWYLQHRYLYIEKGEWWVLDQDVETRTKFIVRDNATTHTIEIWVTGQGTTEFYSLYYHRHVGVTVNIDGITQWLSKEFDIYKPEELPIVRVWIYKSGDLVIIKVRTYHSDQTLAEGYDGQYNWGSAWFTNIVLRQEIEKWGIGWLEATKTDESIITGTEQQPSVPEKPTVTETWLTTLWKYVTGVWSTLGEALPEPIKQFVNSIGAYFSVGWQIMAFAFSIVVKFMPFVMVFYVLYLVGLVITCTNKISINPLVDHLFTVFQVFAQVTSAVVGIVKAIWGFIKFW